MRAIAWPLGVCLILFSGRTAGAQERPCSGITCSGHGSCFEEGETAYCLCDDGFSAVGHTCIPGGPALDPDEPPSGMHVVGVALAEAGRDLRTVGSTRTDAPGPLSRFVPDDGLWCSDFVSWVYRAAGIPFTGGYSGGWHLTNNHMIRAWYVRRGMFVAQGTAEWAHVQPLPGDYVRIHTRTWGHSAIVRYVSRDTLYTVEGNAGGRVITTRYPRWRTHERIDGIGMTTDAAARMNALDERTADAWRR